MTYEYVNRLKSFGWRFGIYLITAGLAWLADNLGLLELNPSLTVFLAFVLGEVSKWWANYQKKLGKTFFGKVKSLTETTL